MKTIRLKTEKDIDKICEYCKMVLVESVFNNKEYDVVIRQVEHKRTSQQNKSIFKYYRIIAKMLNNGGYTMRSFFAKLKKGFEIPVSMDNVRDVAEKVAEDMFNKPVKELSTTQITELHKTIDHGFSLSLGVSSEFPSDKPPVYGAE